MKKNEILDALAKMMNETTGEKRKEVVDIVLDRNSSWEQWADYIENEKKAGTK